MPRIPIRQRMKERQYGHKPQGLNQSYKMTNVRVVPVKHPTYRAETQIDLDINLLSDSVFT